MAVKTKRIKRATEDEIIRQANPTPEQRLKALYGAEDAENPYKHSKPGSKTKRIRKAVETVRVIDATPERLSKGDFSVFVNPAEIDSNEQNIARVRRFSSSMLDRLYRNERITWTQWYAGDWYRNIHQAAITPPSVVANYGERSGGGELNYGLARNERQLSARKKWRAARGAFPQAMIGFMDRLLIHDEMPRYGGDQYMRSIKDIGAALNSLASWLQMPTGLTSDAKPGMES